MEPAVIAALDQLALYYEAMGVNFCDIRADIDSLKSDGINRAILWPGAGVGGHCLTRDTYPRAGAGCQGAIVVGKSKVWPGLTEELMVSVLERQLWSTCTGVSGSGRA